MFFGLKNITSHPCFKMQEIVNSLLWAVVNNEPFGPNIFPVWFGKTYANASAVHKGLLDVHTALLKEKLPFRRSIYSQFINNNAIHLLCDDISYEIEKNINWKKSPAKELKELMIMLYEKLDLAVFKKKKCKQKPLHRYYSDFIKANAYVCPFCFINQYKNRLSPKREDLDHYLCKSAFPLTAANMENLVPMCGECNQTYKRETEIAENKNGRVSAFYPYSDIPEITPIIGCNKYPSLTDVNDNGEWSVILTCSDPSQQDKVENWDRVFSIRQRISDEIAEFHQEWVRDRLLDDDPGVFSDLASFRVYLQGVSEKQFRKSERRNQPKSLLSAALFQFLSENGEDIFLKSFMRQYEYERKAAA